MNTNNFQKNLAHGQKGEVAVANFLTKKGYTLNHYNNDFRYDISMTNKNGQEKLFEVKEDDRSIATSNFYFEIESYSKPSGILTSQSNYWVVLVPSANEGYIFNTKTLREYVQKYFSTIVPGGEGLNTKGAIMNCVSTLGNIAHTVIKFDMSDLVAVKQVNELEDELEANINTEEYLEDELPF